ncbi:hypothetical protein SERLADRAFT_471800 [Serpula lacrymans var. lacrymans S7.9]|uniref:Transmembrane protein 19 n=1 Tax=Serpula lacrymans var. lacrymans (strain S7.9) TaxID=578457 RepID=F8P1R2_SERL9|nr:uncharacterized protein SERLADRAFT_471800 [Serpula lacrymans var. lacrymans S7.9]EGO23091.1 hypothetical protein SERLADRAFT_471800 [Serpula lacrymans var. lacrymans S7.9]
MSWSTIPIVPLGFATALSLHGLRSRSLSPSGAAAAFTVGFLTLAAPVRAIGISLIVFYLLGSRATKYGKKRKATLEDGYQAAGYRTAWQVLCNSFTAFLAAAAWGILYAPNVLPWSIIRQFVSVPEATRYDSDSWCPLSPDVTNGLSRALLFSTLGYVLQSFSERSDSADMIDHDLRHFACCLGDTLASELGILSNSPPILITTLKTVPHGTNGGISLGGTIASMAGGLSMGFVLFASLVLENSKCRQVWGDILVPLVLWGTMAGGMGSMLDSFLGATLQKSRYSVTSKRVLQDDSALCGEDDIKDISGLNLLTNNQVNLISSTLTALVVARLA